MASQEFQLSTYMRARLETWETDVNVSNNTSVVHARIKVWRTNSWSGQTSSTSVTRKIQIGSQVVCDYAEGISYYVSQGEVTVAEASRTVSHNDDGSRTVYCACWLTDNAGSFFSGSTSYDMGLTTIPRAATINSFTGNDVDGTFKVTYTAKSSSFTHKLRISIPGVVALQTNNYSSGTSFSLSASTIQYLYDYTTNSPTVRLGAVIETWNGGTKIGESSELVNTCNITNANPTFSNFTYQDTNSTITAITGNNQILVQGKSNLRVVISSANKATANKSATMSSYSASISGLSATANYSTSDLNIDFSSNAFAAGTQTLSVRAIDSRGYSTAVNKDVTVLAYAAPVINASAVRQNNFENQTTLSVSGTYSPLTVNNTAKNTVSSVQYRYKKQSTSTWGSWTNMTGLTVAPAGTYTTTDKVLDLDNNSAYDFQVKTTDSLGSTTVALVVSIGIPIFRIGTDGYVYNQEQPLMPSHIGQIIMSTTLDTAAKVKAIYGGTWEAWGAGRVPIGVGSNGTTNYSTPEATGGSETHTITNDNLPRGLISVAHIATMENEFYGEGIISKSRGRGLTVEGSPNSISQTTYSHTYAFGKSSPDAVNNRQPYITVYMWKRTA